MTHALTRLPPHCPTHTGYVLRKNYPHEGSTTHTLLRFLSHWTTRGFIMIYLGAVAASSYSINGDKVFCHEPTPSPPVTESESAASDSLDSLPPWVDVSRYLSGALLCGFGLLYMILGFFGADKDDNEEDQADTSKASGGGAPKEEMGPVAGTGSYAENRL